MTFSSSDDNLLPNKEKTAQKCSHFKRPFAAPVVTRWKTAETGPSSDGRLRLRLFFFMPLETVNQTPHPAHGHQVRPEKPDPHPFRFRRLPSRSLLHRCVAIQLVVFHSAASYRMHLLMRHEDSQPSHIRLEPFISLRTEAFTELLAIFARRHSLRSFFVTMKETAFRIVILLGILCACRSYANPDRFRFFLRLTT